MKCVCNWENGIITVGWRSLLFYPPSCWERNCQACWHRNLERQSSRMMGRLSPGLIQRQIEWMFLQMCPCRSQFAIRVQHNIIHVGGQVEGLLRWSSSFLFKSLLSEWKEFCAKLGHLPPVFWWCLLFCRSASGRKLLAATRAPLLPAAEPNRLRQSWEHLYSGHKGTMKRFPTAGLCQLAAAAGSSECKLRTSTINKDMSNRVRTCSTPVRVRASVL